MSPRKIDFRINFQTKSQQKIRQIRYLLLNYFDNSDKAYHFIYFNSYINLLYIFFLMNFIQIDTPKQDIKINLNVLQENIKEILGVISISKIQQTDSSISFLFLQEKTQRIQIITHIKIDLLAQNLNIRSQMITDTLVKIRSQYEKTLLLRRILKLVKTNKLIKFSINPLSGEIFCDLNLSLHSCYNIESIASLVCNTMQIFTKITFVQFINIMSFLDISKINSENFNLHSAQNAEIKNHLAVSNFYCWFVTKSGTTGNSKSSSSFIVYDQFKKKFNEIEKEDKQSVRIKYFNRVYNSNIQKPTIKYLDALTDQKLQKNYLGNGIRNNDDKKQQIKEITIPQQILNKITQNELNCKIQCHQQGDLFVKIRKVKNFNARRRDLDIIKALPQKQFSNIARYFFIKNYPQFNEKYEITNLFQALNIQIFMEKNKESISIFTKLTLMQQLTTFLRYIRDLNLVYQNLLPKNIFIKKALVLKATNFSNVFGFSLNMNNNDQPENSKNLFPYVLSKKFGKDRTCDDQRTDVYSYGVFIYWMIFGKDNTNLKQSTFRKILITQQMLKQKLYRSKISSFAMNQYYGHDIFKLLVSFSLKCCSTQLSMKRPNLKKNDLQELIMLQERPFLDWIVIITKQILSEYQSQYLKF